MQTRRTTLVPLVPLLALGGLVACGLAPSGPAAGAAGTYRLSAMNGAAVPGAIGFGSFAQFVGGGTLILRADGQYAHDVTVGTATQGATGRYTLRGRSIVLQPIDPDGAAARPPALSGAVWGDSVVVVGPDEVRWSFRRAAARP